MKNKTFSAYNPQFSSLASAVLLLAQLAANSDAASWLPVGTMPNQRYVHSATLLPDGKVLVAGGFGNTTVTANADLYDPTTGTWKATGAMATARAAHSATLLPNGKVLIAGGEGVGYTYLASAELYDPATGTWASAGSFSVAREYHTATLLPDGRVLFAAGTGVGNKPLASVEIYDPAHGTWSLAAPLGIARTYHTATLLPNGRVLVVSGVSPTANGVTDSSELYDPATGLWTQTGPVRTARFEHSATLLPNGKVLMTGGLYTDFIATSELYDPATGTWSATGSLNVARREQTATLLPNGKVLITGGQGPSISTQFFLSSAELYDPETGNWTATASMSTGRFVGSATLLPNGRVLVAGGYPSGLASAEEYDWASGSWTNTGPLTTPRGWVQTGFAHTETLLPNGNVLVAGGAKGGFSIDNAEVYDTASGSWATTAPMSTAREAHTATLLAGGKVLVTGGYAPSSALGTAELYDSSSASWNATGPLNNARFNHTATLLPGGRVLIAGGINALQSAEIYEPGTGSFTPAGSLTDSRVGHTATLLPSGKVLLAGGLGSSAILASAELYDPATRTSTATGPLTDGRYTHTATLLPDGKVLVAGGIGGGFVSLQSAELYDPMTGAWTNTGAMIGARAFHTATLLAGGFVLVAGGSTATTLSSAEIYDPATGRWHITASLLQARFVHRAVLLPTGKVLIAGGTSGTSDLASAELYDAGLAFNPAWQPAIATINSPLLIGTNLMVTGSLFRGISEASTGSAQASASDHPVVQLRSIAGERAIFLPAINWSAGSFTSAPVPSLPLGWTMVTMFVNGIPSRSSIINVDVVAPSNSPPIARCHSVIKSADTNCQAMVAPAEVDNGSTDPDNDPITLVLTPAGPYPLGTTAVTLTVTDSHGASNSCGTTVLVLDNTAPVVSCPANMVVTNDPGQCSATVNYIASAIDNCGLLELSATPPSGSVFPPGTTTVTVTAIDRAAHTNACAFTITVVDGEPPQTACQPGPNPSGKKIPPAGNDSQANPDGFFQLLARDNCDPAPSLFVADSASSFVAGPFASGDMVKITKSAGDAPSQQPGPLNIVAHIQLKGDGLLYAVDASGNVSVPQNCFLSPRQ